MLGYESFTSYGYASGASVAITATSALSGSSYIELPETIKKK